MLIYKVSPPRENLVFEPSVFYRTADFKSSSTRPKPGYIQDMLLYAGDERDISLHLFPNIYRVRVWLDDAKRQHLAELGFVTDPDKNVAIFVNEADANQLRDFTPTVYSFVAADFERTPSNEFVSRKPVRAIGAETLTMPDILRRWKIQVIAVPSVEDTEKRLRQAGVECSTQSGRKWTLEFRPLTSSDCDAVLAIARAMPEWFTPKGQAMLAVNLQRQAGYVATAAGRVSGFASFYVNEGVGHIGWIGVAPHQHRHGIGRRLVERIEQELRAAGIEEFRVGTLGDSVEYEPYVGTRAFYRALGFADFKHERLDNPECPEWLILSKRLRSFEI
jgi:GNAT superfamily N-acetyltransferase